MVNQKFYQLGTAPSVIRELFAYGLEQAQVVGPIIPWETPASPPRPRSISPFTTFSTTPIPSRSTGTPWPAASTRPGRPLPPI
jgi:hypothetical protein